MTKDDQKYSEGGSKILRHQPRERDFAAPLSVESACEEIVAHFERSGVNTTSVFHELVSDLVHIDVHISEPEPQRDFFTLFTTGMSDLPMTVPAGAEEYRLAELMLCLPREWKVDSDAEEDYWPIRLLKGLARLPHEYGTWLSIGHTVPNGDPAEPYSTKTRLCCAFLGPPISIPPEASTLVTASGAVINLYSVLPLHPEEVDLKLKKGADALLDAFDAHGVTELLDPQRPPAVRRKLLGIF